MSVRSFLLAAAAFLPSAVSAHAGCSDRPGTPTNVTATQGGRYGELAVSWTNTASEKVWWDVEMTDQTRKVIPQPAGAGPVTKGKGQRVSTSFNVGQGAQRCFRVKARTEAGTNGCLSRDWSNQSCATAPAPGGQVKLRDGDQKRTASLSPIATISAWQERQFNDQPVIGTFTRHGTKCVPYGEFPGVLKGMVGWGQGEAARDACMSYILQLGVDFNLSAFAQNTQITRAILTYDEGPAPLCPLVVGEQNTCWQSGGGSPQDKPNGCVVVRIPSIDWRRKGPNGLVPVLPDGQPAVQQITARKWDVTSALFRRLSPPLGGNPGFGLLLTGGPRSVRELDAMDRTICTSKVTNIRLTVDYVVSTKDTFVQPK